MPLFFEKVRSLVESRPKPGYYSLNVTKAKQFDFIRSLFRSSKAIGLGKTNLLQIELIVAAPHLSINATIPYHPQQNVRCMPNECQNESPTVMHVFVCNRDNLKDVTTNDAYQMPNINGTLSRTNPNILHFQHRQRLLYRVTLAPFQPCAFIDIVIPQSLREYVLVYIDDFLFMSAQSDTHLDLLPQMALYSVWTG